MLTVGFLGALPWSFAERVQAHLKVPCTFVHADEADALEDLPGLGGRHPRAGTCPLTLALTVPHDQRHLRMSTEALHE